MTLLTPQEVATMLRCSARHVLRMAEKGMIDAIVINPESKKVKYRFPLTAVESFVSRQLVSVRQKEVQHV